MAAFALAAGFASPAFARTGDTQAEDFDLPDLESAYDGDYVIVAVGGGYIPDYDGSDDYDVLWGAAARGSISGIGFATRGMGLELDLIPRMPGDVEFSFGPDLRYRKIRTGTVKDEVVDLLPKLNDTFEVGFGGGVAFQKVLTPLDSLAFSFGSRWDVSGEGAGRSDHVSLSYFSALNQGSGAGIALGATHVNGAYADYYYGITPEGSDATGGQLPAYDATGGFKDWSVRLYYGIDLDGNFRNGGWGIATAISYERLLNSAAETPIVAMRGDRDQYAVLLGLGYTF